VSHSTVSRVINGYRNVKPDTVRAVRAAMRKTGYSPLSPDHRPGPRTGAHKGIRWGNILVWWGNLPTELAATNYTQAIDGVTAALIENGLNPVFGRGQNPSLLPPCVLKDRFDGCIIIGGEPDGILAEKLKKLPAVWMSSRRTALGDRVIGGNETIGLVAAAYLIGRGRKTLCFLNPLPNNPAHKARGAGFAFAAHQKGITIKNYIPEKNPPQSMYLESLEELEAATESLVKKMIQQRRSVIGLFVPQDMITASVYRALAKAGVRPGRISTLFRPITRRLIWPDCIRAPRRSISEAGPTGGTLSSS
jgi:DNA-binding LacI/PurR family transcriptional regulator